MEATDASPIKNFNCILIKFGGNAMISPEIKKEFIRQIKILHNKGIKVIITHGGGPFIQDILDKTGIESEFIGGHRYTSKEAMKYIEMALSGEVNTDIVARFNSVGVKAVGLSGKDGGISFSEIRKHSENGKEIDLGMVGNVSEINCELINLLLDSGYLPIISPVSIDKEANTLNINADMFAGHLAGASNVDAYIVLTDVDGLLKDKDKPETLIKEISIDKLELLYGNVIAGGMIPKIESTKIAIKKGAKMAFIINGTKTNSIIDLIEYKKNGTKISNE